MSYALSVIEVMEERRVVNPGEIKEDEWCCKKSIELGVQFSLI